MISDAQKADWALSQGIALDSCKSWLGIHSPPCASDAHDVVVAVGVFEAIDSESTFTRAPLANSVWSTYPHSVWSRSKSASSSGNGKRLRADIQDKVEDTSAPEARLGEGGAPDTSGVQQPVGTGDRLRANIQDVIEDISAPTERLEEGGAPDTSGVQQPAGAGDRLRADLRDVIEDIPAPTERLGEGGAPDTSGVQQPAGTGDRLQADIQDVIEDISCSAVADNGALQMAMHQTPADTKPQG